MKNLKKIKGDASFRKFFRKKKDNFNTIIVFAKKEKYKNLLIYDAINKIMNKNSILAPALYSENYKKNYIEIQDFGNKTIYKILKKSKNKFFYFKKIIDILKNIQSIKDRTIITFKNKKYKIPQYDSKIIIKEASLFCDWYLKKNLSTNNRVKFTKKFKNVLKELITKLRSKNNVFVHRDFHVSNLMLIEKRIGIIDSQDAVIGNKAYDLASLIDDVRFKTSKKLKEKIFFYYTRKYSKLEKNNLKNDFEILSVLRNLKIIGIFTRLAIRDGKKNYLRLIPYAWKLIDIRIKENNVFSNLRDLLNQNLKKKK